MRAWLKKTFTYKADGWDIAFFVLLTVLFFALPVFLAPDSSSYLNNARVLEGRLPFSEWDSLRGPVLPVLLRLGFGLFGDSAAGAAPLMYGVYLCYVASALYLCYLLGLSQRLGKPPTWGLCTVFLFANPTVLTYAHYVLTEFFALALALPAFCAVVKTQQLLRRPGARQWAVRLWRYGLVIAASVALYALKQMFFVFAAVPFLLSELILLCGHFSWKRLAAGALALAALCAAVPLWSMAWDASLKGKTEVREDLSAHSIAYSSLIDGLRYFRPEERYTIGKQVRIDVMADDYKTVEKSFTYTFSGTLGGSVHYLATCFAQSPGRFVQSWKHNYLVIANVRRLMDYSVTRAYTPVTKTNWFIQAFETHAWLERFKNLPEGGSGYDEHESPDPRYVQPVDGGLASNLIFNTGYPVFAYFCYSFPAFCAPFVLAGAAVMSVLRRKTEKAAFWHWLVLLSGSIFLCIFILAVTASNIDRYGFPATAWTNLLLLLPAVVALQAGWGRARAWLSAKRRG